MINNSPDEALEEQFDGSIPDHEILRCIGSGSFGRVWLARTQFGSYRAVKTVERATFGSVQKAFELEWEGIKKYEEISIQHPQLVSIFHAGRAPDDSYFYYIMEIGDDVVTGREINPDNYQVHTLHNHIFELNKRLSVGDCIDVGIKLSDALGQFHDHGLLHRDVKPSNIIFVHGIPKLTDMGLVSEIDESQEYTIGTEGYSPTEGSNSVEADIFSLGKTIYEAATGLDRKVFPNIPKNWKDPNEKAAFAGLNEVLVNACHPEKERRFQSAQDLKRELIELQNAKSIKRYQTKIKNAENLRLIAKIGFAISAILISIFLVLYQKVQHEKTLSRMAMRAQATMIGGAKLAGRLTHIHGSYYKTIDFLHNSFNPDYDKLDEVSARLMSTEISHYPAIEYFGHSLEKGDYFKNNVPANSQDKWVNLYDGRFIDNDSKIIVAGEAGYVAIFDVPELISDSKFLDPQDALVLQKDLASNANVIAKHPSKPWVYVGADNLRVHAYNFLSGERVGSLLPNKELVDDLNQESLDSIPLIVHDLQPEVIDIKFSSDKSKIAVLYSEFRLQIFDAETWKPISIFKHWGDIRNIKKIFSIEWSHSDSTILCNTSEFSDESVIGSKRAEIVVCKIHQDENGFINISNFYPYYTTSQIMISSLNKGHQKNHFYIPKTFKNIGSLYFDETHFLNSTNISESVSEILQQNPMYTDVTTSGYHRGMNLIASASKPSSILISTGEDIQNGLIEFPSHGLSTSLDWSQNGLRLLSVTLDGFISIYNLAGAAPFHFQHFGDLFEDTGICVDFISNTNIEIRALDEPSGIQPLPISIDNFDEAVTKILDAKPSIDGSHIAFHLLINSSRVWKSVELEKLQVLLKDPSAQLSFDHELDINPLAEEFQFLPDPFLIIQKVKADDVGYEIELTNHSSDSVRYKTNMPNGLTYSLSLNKEFILFGSGQINLDRSGSSPYWESSKIVSLHIKSLELVSEFEFPLPHEWIHFIKFDQESNHFFISLDGSDFRHREGLLGKFNQDNGKFSSKFVPSVHYQRANEVFFINKPNEYATLDETDFFSIWKGSNRTDLIALGDKLPLTNTLYRHKLNIKLDGLQKNRFKFSSSIRHVKESRDQINALIHNERGSINLFNKSAVEHSLLNLFVEFKETDSFYFAEKNNIFYINDDEKSFSHYRLLSPPFANKDLFHLMEFLVFDIGKSHSRNYRKNKFYAYIKAKESVPELFHIEPKDIKRFYQWMRSINQRASTKTSARVIAFIDQQLESLKSKTSD